MKTEEQIPGDDEAWDEGRLGRDPAYAHRVPLTPEQQAQLLKALEGRDDEAALAARSAT